MEIRIIPVESSFDIYTNMSKTQVLNRLRSKVADSRPLFAINAANVFVGQVYDTGFDIKEDVLLNRTLNPNFHGKFKETNNGLLVRVKMSNLLATIFTLWAWTVWLGMLIWLITSLIGMDFKTALGLACVDVIGIIAITITTQLYYGRAQAGERRLRLLFAEKEKER